MTSSLIRLPRNQHTVSKVVLKRFTWHKVMSVFDRQRGRIETKGTRRIFTTEYFDGHDPVGAEQRWHEVEIKMDPVYRLLESRTALDDDAAVSTLRDLMAVHWARSPAARAMHERITDEVVANSVRNVATRPDILRKEFTKQMGLVAAGQGELDWINVELHRRAASAHREQWWSERNAKHYDFARQHFAKWAVQIAYATSGDFVIGDAPVVTTKGGHEGVGPHQGVALGDASMICMPISPEILIALGPDPALVTVGSDVVQHYNRLQAQGFCRWLGCRPGGISDRAIRAARSQAVSPPGL